MTTPSDPTPSSSSSKPHESGAYAAWGLIIVGAVAAVPAFVLGGRWYAIAAFAATIGWAIGAFIDRSRS